MTNEERTQQLIKLNKRERTLDLIFIVVGLLLLVVDLFSIKTSREKKKLLKTTTIDIEPNDQIRFINTPDTEPNRPTIKVLKLTKPDYVHESNNYIVESTTTPIVRETDNESPSIENTD